MAGKNRAGATAKRITQLRNYILSHLRADQEEVMRELKIGSPAGLYSLLLGMADDAQICTRGKYQVYWGKKPLTAKFMEEYLEKNPAGGKNAPGVPERLLYLYYSLHNAIPTGGLSFKDIRNNYEELFFSSGGKLPKDSSLNRMIYRDLIELEQLHIGIERPESGSRKYCLRDKYLPKLTAEGAAAVYVSMLLYRDTLLDEATFSCRGEIEKAFFKGFPERSKVLQERVYVLGDKLASPADFGNVFGKLVRAVAESLRIKMEYMNNEGRHSVRILEPLGLVCKRNVWYLIAREEDSGDIRTFRADQIISLTLKETEKFIYPLQFSLVGHIGSSWGVFHNDEVERVVLKFSGRVAHRVTRLCYHPSQQILEQCSDGSVIMQFEACGLMEMQNWILQWGEQVEVMAPLHLQDAIRERAEQIAAKYKRKQAKSKKPASLDTNKNRD